MTEPASVELLRVEVRLARRNDRGFVAWASYEGQSIVTFDDLPQDALATAARKLGAVVSKALDLDE
jgi:hypothetical protein